ncbi:MAG: hypothetical protein SNJ78_12540 [Spirochaetales bacterium]
MSLDRSNGFLWGRAYTNATGSSRYLVRGIEASAGRLGKAGTVDVVGEEAESWTDEELLQLFKKLQG